MKKLMVGVMLSSGVVLGAYAGEGEGAGTGIGAGMGMGPVGFLVTKGDEIQFLPARSTKGLSAVFEKVPELIDKYLQQKNSGKAGVPV